VTREIACAFAPGHVTGLFAVHDEATDPLRKGSRGAGWTLDKGAWARVQRTDETVFLVNGEPDHAPVTETALALLAPDEPLAVDLRLDLPIGQGFGMSAAGTLAACLATTSLLDLEPERALEATHTAEVATGAGLGDAIGSWFGSGEVRIKPGCPPHGWAMRVEPPADTRFLYCVLGESIPTQDIIRNDEWKAATVRHGDNAVDRILDAGRERAWESILEESIGFGSQLGLMPTRMLALGQKLPKDVQWGQCMLGSTMWVTGKRGDLERAEALLEGHGPVFHANVDPNGARMVRELPPLVPP
jgi:pantoate kinase